MTKYRRVSNVFPQVIAKPLEEDSIFTHPASVDLSANMTDRKSSQHSRLNNSNSKSNISNPNLNSYAEIEYSDDDDDVIFKNPRHRTVVNSTPSTTGLENFKKHQLNAIFPDHIPVIVRNTRPRTLNTSKNNSRTSKPVLNGNISDIPPLVRAFNNSRDVSLTKSDSSGDTWHKRLSARPSRESTKCIPPLIDTRTGRLAAPSITIDRAADFGSSRTYVNGIDYPNETKITNGIVADSYSRVSSISQQQSHPSQTQRKVRNSSAEKAFGIRDRNTYMELLKRIAPALYKSNDSERDRQQLGQLADARNAKSANQRTVVTVELLDDENDETQQKDIIDLSNDDIQMISACQKIQSSTKNERKVGLPAVEPVNSLKDRLESTPALQPDWLEKFSNVYKERSRLNKQHIIEAEENARKFSKDTEQQEKLLVDKLRNCMVHQETIILDESEEEEEEEFPEFTEEQHSIVKRALYRGSQDEVLISKFNMNITRRDIYTLVGDTWLNDEVINFYMNLLMERSEQRSSEGLPKVYAMNTFFVPRLLQSGHGAVRRWTRKVDIFSYDVIPVPVHVGQVHWCMAIIHLKQKTIKYYDSMGTPNPRLLNALEDYLREESLDKRKEPFDTSKFHKESVADAPRQMNGSDCGVFSCMFAEYITRNRQITFSQENMPYFRRKMILEIVQGKLLL